MELGLNNRSVLIAGGSKGIGLACARGFLDEGARVAIVSRDRGNLDKAAANFCKVALFLASDQAAYVTGAVIPMDGGSNPII